MRIIPALDGLRQEKFNLIYRAIWLVLKPARGGFAVNVVILAQSPLPVKFDFSGIMPPQLLLSITFT